MYNKITRSGRTRNRAARIATLIFFGLIATAMVGAQPFPEGAEPPKPRSALPDAFLAQSPPSGAVGSFSTDFSRATISFADIISGGPPKDGIPAIDEPRFVSLRNAQAWLENQESVFLVEAGGEVKIYPVQILMWHEVVNDVVGGVPVTITYCPLCNTGVAFLRRYDGTTLDFGVSGRLRFSNMIMYDRQTESWWQQASGRAVAGEYAGGRLARHPMLMLSFGEAKSNWPRARVLSRETGHNRAYGRNPYSGYDSSSQPFLYRGPAIDGDWDPMTRVVMVEAGGEQEPFAYPELEEKGIAQTRVGGVPIVVFFDPEATSPLDASTVAGGREVGAANAFLARLDNRRLTFETLETGRYRDRQTRSTWNAAGRAISGELLGRQLEPAETVQHFWFSYTAFEE